MATYEYVCLACEHAFERRRSMTAAVETATLCASCGSDRVRRRFSVFATGSTGRTVADGPASGAGGAGCACGGACACRGH